MKLVRKVRLAFTSFILGITYNNRRQRLGITYGSGVETEGTYDTSK